MNDPHPKIHYAHKNMYAGQKRNAFIRQVKSLFYKFWFIELLIEFGKLCTEQGYCEYA